MYIHFLFGRLSERNEMKLKKLLSHFVRISVLLLMTKFLGATCLYHNKSRPLVNILNDFQKSQKRSVSAFHHTLRSRDLSVKKFHAFDRKSVISCGLHIKIHIRGKGTNDFLCDGYQEYEKRLRPILNLETAWYKTDEDMLKGIEKINHSEVVCLDPNGKQMTSEKFSTFLYNKLEKGGSRLSFVIGGAEGLPASLREKNQQNLLSLSDLTFTHQWARVILAEQIYRATEIHKGSGYHKS